MAFPTFEQYKTDLGEVSQQLPLTVAAAGGAAGRWYDLWMKTVPLPTAPTSAVVPTNATPGSLGQQDSTSATLSIIGSRFNSRNPGVYIIYDRLSHQGGLSATTTGAQTTNLPTAALTRYTDGVGVMAALTIYTQIGTTGTTATVSYTNEANTSGRTSPLVVFGGTTFREIDRMILLPLQEGDSGVRAVASVTLAASTVTAGNFGVTLFKPLYVIIVDETNGISVTDFFTGKAPCGVPEVLDGACLGLMTMSASTAIAGGGILLLEEH